MSLADFQSKVRAYDTRVAAYLPDVRIIEPLLSDPEGNRALLLPFAGKVFDGNCALSNEHGGCTCAYCRTRKALGLSLQQTEMDDAERRGYDRVRRPLR